MCRWCIWNWHMKYSIFYVPPFQLTRCIKLIEHYTQTSNSTRSKERHRESKIQTKSEWYIFKLNEFKLCTPDSHWPKSRWQFIIVLNSRSFTSYHWFDAISLLHTPSILQFNKLCGMVACFFFYFVNFLSLIFSYLFFCFQKCSNDFNAVH